jgi:hypothetical protein
MSWSMVGGQCWAWRTVAPAVHVLHDLAHLTLLLRGQLVDGVERVVLEDDEQRLSLVARRIGLWIDRPGVDDRDGGGLGRSRLGAGGDVRRGLENGGEQEEPSGAAHASHLRRRL